MHLTFQGIEERPKTAEAARQSLAGEAKIETADLRTAELPQADAILLLDVLHYLPAADQEALLARTAAALAPGGVLLIRDADADAGWRFTATRIQERFSSLLRGHPRQRFHYRSAAEWRRLLEELGLTVDLQPMGMGTPYANVLLAGRQSNPNPAPPGASFPSPGREPWDWEGGGSSPRIPGLTPWAGENDALKGLSD